MTLLDIDTSKSDRLAEFTMTFPHSYNAKSAQAEGVVIKKSVEKHHGLGQCTVKTPYGNEVLSYDVERTLCDIVRGDGSLDVQLVNPAMKAYAASKEKNVNKLHDSRRRKRL